MKKYMLLSWAILLSLLFCNPSFAEDMQNIQDLSQISGENEIAESTEIASVPVLKTPVVEDTKLKKNSLENKKLNKSAKIDLKAVIFDPNADFTAQAKEENREMTRFEEAEESVHEALHGEISSMSTLSKKGLLQKQMTYYPESGILDNINVYTGYRGILSNVWQNGDYKNTLYSMDSLSTTFEGLFKDKKTSFRSMFNFNKSKEGHDFFNDLWGDQYIQYAWTKNDQFLLGYKRNSLGVEGSMGPWALPFISRSQIDKTYNNVRALGVKAQGQHKLYEYTLELSSSGRNFLDWFPGPEMATSFGVRPLGLTDGKYGNLLIGGAFNAGNAEGKYDIGMGYIDYEYKRFNSTFEYGVADGSNGSTGYTTNKSEGFNETLAYRITKRLQALVRYDYFDPNKDKYNDIRQEYTVGMNYFIKDHSVQLMLNYTWYTVQSGTYGSRILFATQILL